LTGGSWAHLAVYSLQICGSCMLQICAILCRRGKENMFLPPVRAAQLSCDLSSLLGEKKEDLFLEKERKGRLQSGKWANCSMTRRLELEL